MKRFHEFDYVHTPDNWKEIPWEIKKYKSYHMKKSLFTIFLTSFLFLSSIGLISAYSDNLKIWIHHNFSNNGEEFVENTFLNENWRIEDIFLYYYHNEQDKEVVEQVFAFENGMFEEKKLMHKEINDKYSFSFDYVISGNHIFGCNYQGQILNILPIKKNDVIYLEMFQPDDLCMFDLNTNTLTKITDDGISVNMIMSKEGSNILINKSDQYWTNYNIDNKKETRIYAIGPYAHSNDLDFLNDNLIICFDEEGNTRVIDTSTLKVIDYHKPGYYPIISTMVIDISTDHVQITDLLTNNIKDISLDHAKNYDYWVYLNRYIVFESNSDNSCVIYDFKENNQVNLKEYGYLLDKEFLFIDESYGIFFNQKNYYIIPLVSIFHDE